MSVEFFDLVLSLYKDRGPREALDGRQQHPL